MMKLIKVKEIRSGQEKIAILSIVISSLLLVACIIAITVFAVEGKWTEVIVFLFGTAVWFKTLEFFVVKILKKPKPFF